MQQIQDVLGGSIVANFFPADCGLYLLPYFLELLEEGSLVVTRKFSGDIFSGKLWPIRLLNHKLGVNVFEHFALEHVPRQMLLDALLKLILNLVFGGTTNNWFAQHEINNNR